MRLFMDVVKRTMSISSLCPVFGFSRFSTSFVRPTESSFSKCTSFAAHSTHSSRMLFSCSKYWYAMFTVLGDGFVALFASTGTSRAEDLVGLSDSTWALSGSRLRPIVSAQLGLSVCVPCDMVTMVTGSGTLSKGCSFFFPEVLWRRVSSSAATGSGTGVADLGSGSRLFPKGVEARAGRGARVGLLPCLTGEVVFWRGGNGWAGV
mmetsp:Transcript_140457/g.244539  ORF Transcript_140457/g.244539 Transcript_140457/m.244539 type:complete len:206 (-) Transcript_140457:543-1160(-)